MIRFNMIHQAKLLLLLLKYKHTYELNSDQINEINNVLEFELYYVH